MDLENRVRRTIRRGKMAGPATRVVAAVSGGSDSVALVHLLRALDAAGELRLVALAHFNHQLRGEADADQRFCAAIAEALSLPFSTDSADVRALSVREHRSIEDAARTARHAFLERARVEAAADVVALGHTRDDQAETFLLRLLRGAGSQGLGAMHPGNGRIIRPLLECRRDELIGHLGSLGASFVDDASNADLSIPRNRVRAELIPMLAARFNPSVVDALADAAEVAREDWGWLSAAAEALEHHSTIVDTTDSGDCRNQNADQRRNEDRTPSLVVIDAAVLGAAPVAVARAALRRMMMRASAGRFVGFDAVERARQLSRGDGGDFDAPGQRVQRIGSTIVLTGRPPGAIGRGTVSNPIGAFRYALSIPGEVELTETGAVISAEEPAARTRPQPGSDAETSHGAQWGPPPVLQNTPVPANATTVMVRRDLCGAQLAVRNRRPGDRFRPAGVDGRKKLQDFFVDHKIERRHRDLVPLVVDESDRIVWVAGHAVNDEFRVTDPAQAVIILRLKGVGGAV
jgi:tRNA(Ile)-lysidine synthase